MPERQAVNAAFGLEERVRSAVRRGGNGDDCIGPKIESGFLNAWCVIFKVQGVLCASERTYGALRQPYWNTVAGLEIKCHAIFSAL
jgi:hypothetical protein